MNEGPLFRHRGASALQAMEAVGADPEKQESVVALGELGSTHWGHGVGQGKKGRT